MLKGRKRPDTELQSALRLTVPQRNTQFPQSQQMAASEAVIVDGLLSIDSRLRMVRIGEQPKRLTRGQYDLLVTLVHRIGEVVPFCDLHDAACGVSQWNGDTRAVRQLVSKLTRAIGPAGTLIKNYRGVGYAMVPSSAQQD